MYIGGRGGLRPSLGILRGRDRQSPCTSPPWDEARREASFREQ
ncbi:hypothetical protein HMPREF1556_01307 [Porphyromonas sp. oral taxon 278 str. W7784]|nr:hypothetical protein HMPREF1556_01307 [Porphyromonas sp. oral taxon 278 str. W7784]